jgi:hypothetical protein
MATRTKHPRYPHFTGKRRHIMLTQESVQPEPSDGRLGHAQAPAFAVLRSGLDAGPMLLPKLVNIAALESRKVAT